MNTNTQDTIIGVDFGTTNSSAAIYKDNNVKFFQLEDDAEDKNTLKSAIFIHNDGSIVVGQKAILDYLEKFEGHEIKTGDRSTDNLQVSWTWEGHFYYDYLREEYELNPPGRLILSPKRIMPTPLLDNIEYGEKKYTPENLGTIILSDIKKKVEEQLGYDVKSINLGRPVHYSDEAENDELAIKRVTQAAKDAGFENIYFTFEPVGAAYNYSVNNIGEKIGIVFDFGGGTFDTSVVKFIDNHIEILGSEGVYVGGNKFNEEVIYNKFMSNFGKDEKYQNVHPLVPEWIMRGATRWEMSQVLRRKDNLDNLDYIARQAKNPEKVRNLITLIKYNLGLSLFLLAEKGKIDIGKIDARDIDIVWDNGQIHVKEKLNREEFKKMVWGDVARIAGCMRIALEKAKLEYEQIDIVIKTGGSSKVFFINELLQNIFPNAEIYENNAFTDVTAGLAIRATEIMNNE